MSSLILAQQQSPETGALSSQHELRHAHISQTVRDRNADTFLWSTVNGKYGEGLNHKYQLVASE